MQFNNIGRIQLPSAGTYHLTITSVNGDIGAYSFDVSSMEDQANSYSLGTVVASNVPVAGEGILASAGQTDKYLFAAPTNLLIDVTALSWPAGGAYWVLYGPNQTQIFSTYMQFNNIGRLQLPVEGTYRLTIGTANNDTGSYSFQINRITNKEFAINLADTVSANTPAAGAGILDEPGEFDFYTYQGIGGQNVSFVDKQHLSGTATWTLLSAKREPSFFLSIGRFRSSSSLTLPMTGTYTIDVQGSECNANQLLF